MLVDLRGRLARRLLFATFVAVSSAFCAIAQSVVHIDATAPAPAPTPVPASLGSSRNPHGDVLGANSQYFTFNGKPWIPVMGEFHFSRYPQAQWEQEILKMKAAGVGIISTYVIWIHHEQTQGKFDWTGQRDLRTFTQLCARHGMYVYPRIGPWAHAEVRNGGLPDWVLKAGPTRQNDPIYLREVASFYAEIGRQLHGLYWKDGGPIIGIQLENEYRAHGPGKGAEHIRTLKKLARDNGMDVPFYTVTGWDGATIPLDAALPVFGGYPDAPWDGSAGALPANEVYAFRFANRSAGSMGAIGGRGQSAADTYKDTPFLTAEVGAGIQDTYFRRPVLTPDDIASIAPVMLGSGANLLGYYMFHGGRNPDGGDITLQESQRTGYPTDVPVKSYDFQAPLGEFGQERPSLNKLKLVHYFLEDFGSQLAPMLPHEPSALPASPTDLTVPRVSARTLNDTGFVFFNNHIRGVSAPSFPGFQVELKTPSGTTHIPEQPIDLPPDTYGIWPLNLDLGPTRLLYSTAQLLKRVTVDRHTFFFFFTIPGIPPELLVPTGTTILHTDARQQTTAGGLRLRPDTTATSTVQLGNKTTLVILPESQAENLWRGDNPSILLSTAADAFSDADTWHLQSTGESRFAFGVFGTSSKASAPGLHTTKTGDLFRQYTAAVPPVTLNIKATADHLASRRKPFEMGPSLPWRKNAVPFAPEDRDFTDVAASWTLQVPALPAGGQLADAFLRIRYQGDAARLYAGPTLLDDNFWNGVPWEIGLREVQSATRKPRSRQTMELRILPLPPDSPMYIEKAKGESGIPASLDSVELVPRYQLTIQLP